MKHFFEKITMILNIIDEIFSGRECSTQYIWYKDKDAQGYSYQ